MKIQFVQQPTDETCTSSCLAMLIENKTVMDVIEEFHEDYFAGKITPASYLRKIGFKVREFSGLERTMIFGCVYLLCVPSLNKEATFHSILLDVQDSATVYDPCTGVKGKKYYTYDEYKDPLSAKLKGFIIDCEITRGA